MIEVMSANEVLATGVTQADAARALERDGYNELPAARPRSLASIAWSVAREPMLLMLMAAAAIYVVLGDLREAAVLAVSVAFVLALAFHQERKSARALEALRVLASPRAMVYRDGEWREGQRILREEGDVDQVAAGLDDGAGGGEAHESGHRADHQVGVGHRGAYRGGIAEVRRA